jgi:hypothetical protein
MGYSFGRAVRSIHFCNKCPFRSLSALRNVSASPTKRNVASYPKERMGKILIGTAERAEELVWWRFGWT